MKDTRGGRGVPSEWHEKVVPLTPPGNDEAAHQRGGGFSRGPGWWLRAGDSKPGDSLDAGEKRGRSVGGLEQRPQRRAELQV